MFSRAFGWIKTNDRDVIIHHCMVLFFSVDLTCSVAQTPGKVIMEPNEFCLPVNEKQVGFFDLDLCQVFVVFQMITFVYF